MEMSESDIVIPEEVWRHILSFNLVPYTLGVNTMLSRLEESLVGMRFSYMRDIPRYVDDHIYNERWEIVKYLLFQSNVEAHDHIEAMEMLCEKNKFSMAMQLYRMSNHDTSRDILIRHLVLTNRIDDVYDLCISTRYKCRCDVVSIAIGYACMYNRKRIIDKIYDNGIVGTYHLLYRIIDKHNLPYLSHYIKDIRGGWYNDLALHAAKCGNIEALILLVMTGRCDSRYLLINTTNERAREYLRSLGTTRYTYRRDNQVVIQERKLSLEAFLHDSELEV